MSGEREKCPQILSCSKARLSPSPKHLFFQLRTQPSFSHDGLTLWSLNGGATVCEQLPWIWFQWSSVYGSRFQAPSPKKRFTCLLPWELLTYKIPQAYSKVPSNITVKTYQRTKHPHFAVSATDLISRRLSGSEGNPPLLLSAASDSGWHPSHTCS